MGADRTPVDLNADDARLIRRTQSSPLIWAISIGVQATMGLIVVLGPLRPRASELTSFGKVFTRPEYDIYCYIAGSVLTVALSLIAVICWNKRILSLPEKLRVKWANNTSHLIKTVSAGSTILAIGFVVPCAYMLETYNRTGLWYCIALLALPAGIGLGLVLWFQRPSYICNAHRIPIIANAAIPFFIIGILFVPDWRTLTGRIYGTDSFLHIDAFVMSPAWGMIHGGTLGTDVYSQYGLGWPTLVSLLASVFSISYGHIALLSMICSCLYLAGVYSLSRSLRIGPGWCLLGIVLILYFKVFPSLEPAFTRWVIWSFPQSNFMRHLLDIFVISALWQHLSLSRLRAAILAGAAGGLSLFLVTDSGIFLFGMLVFYFILKIGLAWRKNDPASLRLHLRGVAACLGAYFAIFLLGALVAARGSILDGAFWAGWLKGIIDSGGAEGFGSSPLANSAASSLVLFVSIFLVYMIALCNGIITIIRGSAQNTDVLKACIAAYGLATLIQFVGRSDPLVLQNVTIPFVLLLTIYADRMARRAYLFLGLSRGSAALRRSLRYGLSLIPWALALLVTVFLGIHSERSKYASPFAFAAGLTYKEVLNFNTFRPDHKDETACLFDSPLDCCGLPENMVQSFNETIDELRILAGTGKSVAVITTFETSYYVAAQMQPWPQGAYLLELRTERSREEYIQALVESRPDYVFLAGPKRRLLSYDVYFEDTLDRLRAALRENYTLDSRVHRFQIWRHTGRRRSR